MVAVKEGVDKVMGVNFRMAVSDEEGTGDKAK
jgi:hypothetical protein